jgi:hypothetical protein
MKYTLTLPLFVLLFIAGCSSEKKPVEIEVPVQIAAYPLNSLNDIVGTIDVAFDTLVSADGNGSIRIDTDESITVPLIQTQQIDADNCQLIYRAEVKSQDLTGRAYLEMWCWFENEGEYFSRDLQTPIMGNTDWSTEETLFILPEGKKPDRVRLNIVIDGSGTVWIDDIRLLKAPLEPEP